MYCEKCGNFISDEMKFCSNCGQAVQYAEDSGDSILEPTIEKTDYNQKCKKKSHKGRWIFILASIVVLIIVAICVVMGALFGGSDQTNKNVQQNEEKEKTSANGNNVMYVKEDIFSYDLDRDEKPMKITDKLADAEYIEDGGVDWYCDIDLDVTVSKDGALVFYPDKVDSDNEASLCYRNIKDKNTSSIEVDSGVISYSVNSDATIVTYLKGESQDLYQYTIKTDSRQKIATDVKDYELSEDHNKIIFLTMDGSVYIKNTDSAYGDMLARNAYYFNHVSDDLSTVWYESEDGVLSRLVIGKGTERIDSDVYRVVHVYDSGEAYYLKENTESSYALYFFNGTECKVVTRFISGSAYDFEYAYDYPVIAYNALQEDMQSVQKMYIAIGDTEYSIQQNSVSDFFVNKSGSKVYFVDATQGEKQYGNLYYISINNSEVTSPKIYDENVNYGLEVGNHVVCFKNCNSDAGDMYIDKEKIASDVDISTVLFYEDDDVFLYYTNFHEPPGAVAPAGTLHIFKNNVSDKIAENVTFLPAFIDGKVAYLCDYSWDFCSGKLYIWDNGVNKKIDDDVYYLLVPFEDKYICW